MCVCGRYVCMNVYMSACVYVCVCVYTECVCPYMWRLEVAIGLSPSGTHPSYSLSHLAVGHPSSLPSEARFTLVFM